MWPQKMEHKKRHQWATYENPHLLALVANSQKKMQHTMRKRYNKLNQEIVSFLMFHFIRGHLGLGKNIPLPMNFHNAKLFYNIPSNSWLVRQAIFWKTKSFFRPSTRPRERPLWLPTPWKSLWISRSPWKRKAMLTYPWPNLLHSSSLLYPIWSSWTTCTACRWLPSLAFTEGHSR